MLSFYTTEILQGSAATDSRLGGTFNSGLHRSSLHNVTVRELKSVRFAEIASLTTEKYPVTSKVIVLDSC